MDQKDRFNETLSQCMDRLFKGETIDQVLADYPQEAKELEPLLRTAAAARVFAQTQPRQDFKSRARYEFMTAVREMETKPRRHSFFDFLRQPAWAISLSAILVIVMAGGGTVAASVDSMPGETLYSVKLAAEQVRLAVTPSDVSRTELNAKYANRRATEIEYLAVGGDTEQIQITAARLNNNMVNMTDLAGEGISVENVKSGPETPQALMLDTKTAAPGVDARSSAVPAAGGSGQAPAPSVVVTELPPRAAVATDTVQTPMLAPAPRFSGTSENAKSADGNFSTDSSPSQEFTRNQDDESNKTSDSNRKLTKNERMRKIIEKNYQERKARLEKALEIAKSSARPAIKQAIADSEVEYQKALKNLDEGKANSERKANNK